MEKMRKILLRAVPFFPPREVIGMTSIILFTLFWRMTRILSFQFNSDESIYYYSSNVILQGVIPYREIQLAHPPFMYLIYAVFIRLTGPNFLYLRLWTVAIITTTIFLVYVMVKVVLGNQKESGKLGLLSAAIFAFYPVILGLTYPLETVLTVFTLLSAIVYVKSYSSRRKALLFLSGILMGCAFMTKLPAIFFIATILLYHVIYAVWHKEYKRVFVDIPVILLGVIVPLTFIFVWITFSCAALPQFYLQVFQWQAIRPPQMLEERQSNISLYINAFLPLIVTGALSVPHCIKRGKDANYQVILPALLYGSNMLAFLAPFSRFILFHYFFYLSPYLIFLVAMFFYQITQMLKKKPKISVKSDFILLLVYLIILSATLLQYLIYSVPLLTANTRTWVAPFSDDPCAKVEYYIGKYVATITISSDKIWTSEGAIAFFAQRTITAPNSSNWPVHAFFSDMFDVLSPNQFAQAWEKEKTKVIIFIRGSGWVPYPDEPIWSGISNQTGVAGYIQEKYVLKTFITASEIPYTYHIWVRK